MSYVLPTGYKGAQVTGLEQLAKNIDATLKQIKVAAQAGMSKWVHAIKEDIDGRVPKDTGNLATSFFIAKKGSKSIKRPIFNSYGKSESRQRKLQRSYQDWDSVTAWALAKTASYVGTSTAIIIFGFPLEYALKVHEDLDEGNNPGGGERKFLENSINDNLEYLPKFCAESVKGALSHRGSGSPMSSASPGNLDDLRRVLESI